MLREAEWCDDACTEFCNITLYARSGVFAERPRGLYAFLNRLGQRLIKEIPFERNGVDLRSASGVKLWKWGCSIVLLKETFEYSWRSPIAGL